MRSRDWGSERGAAIVHVGVALLGLLAFSALSIDYGVMWASRRQAQNAADAAALAGAVSLAFVDPDDQDRARAAAAATGRENLVWAEQPVIDAASDVLVGACPANTTGIPGSIPGTCVRANVFRNQERSNPLPTYFAQLVDIEAQGVRATATSQVLAADATTCLKPWAVADRWEEHWPTPGPWTDSSVFDNYINQAGQYVPNPAFPPSLGDVYVAPTLGGPGTGFQPFDGANNQTADYGRQLTLRLGSAQTQLSSGWFLALDLAGGSYLDNITACNATVFEIGDTVTVSADQAVSGQTDEGVGGGGGALGLIDRDPGASWDAASLTVINSCAPGTCADGLYYSRSPRLVAIPLFDVDAFFAGSPTGQPTVSITNIMGFFVEGTAGAGNVTGRLVALAGRRRGQPSMNNSSAFLRTVALVR